MTTEVHVMLDDPHVPWYSSGQEGSAEPHVLGRGYAEVAGTFREGQGLVDAVGALCRDGARGQPSEQLKQLIPSFNGHWALVVCWPDGSVLAAVDRLRSVPVFYTMLPGRFVLTASAQDAQRQRSHREIDDLAALEFLLVGYVTGDATLYKNVHQVQPGEIIEFDPNGQSAQPRSERYHRFLPRQYSTASEEELEEELAAVCDEVFAPLAANTDGGKIVIPLSGGLDSRLVAWMVKKHGSGDVLCYSYGRKGNEESDCSRRIAEALGFEWRFVEFSGDVWTQAIASKEMREYWWYGSKGVSLPFIQDFPAITRLMGQEGFPYDPIFFPGHIGDMLAGSQIPAAYDRLEASPKDVGVADQLLKTYYWNWPLESLPKKGDLVLSLHDKVKRLSDAPASYEGCSPVARYEMWSADNRHGLFIINSVRAYEFFSARWRMLCDYRFMDFYLKVPIEYRVGKRLYVNALRKRIHTGPAADLARIPIVSVGGVGVVNAEWTEDLPDLYRAREQRRGFSTVAKHLARGALSRLGLLELAMNLTHPRSDHCPSRPSETWFARGKDPKTLTVRDVLEPYGTLDKLPRAVLPLIEKRLKRRSDLVTTNGLCAAVVLGEICAGADGGQTSTDRPATGTA